MSNKLKVVICVVMTCVFILIPFSAFAKTDNVSPTKLIQIAKDANPDMYTIDSNHSTAIFEDDNNYYLVVASRVINFVCEGYGSPFECVRPGTNSFNYQKYIYPKLNIYDVSYDTHDCNAVIERVWTFGYPTKFIYSNKDIYQGRQGAVPNTDKIFFSKMNSIPSNPPSRVPLHTVISSIQLTGILKELIAVLPLLLPVLITFIAIRKGIAFCLATLRTA